MLYEVIGYPKGNRKYNQTLHKTTIDFIKKDNCRNLHFNIPFLSNVEFEEFNLIGYSGHDSSGNRMSQEKYLKGIRRYKGCITFTRLSYDPCELTEEIIISLKRREEC